MNRLDQLINDFCDVLGVKWQPPADLLEDAASALRGCGERNLLGAEHRRDKLIAQINSKFGFNDAGYRSFLDQAAEDGTYLNYDDKLALRDALDHADGTRLKQWISHRHFDQRLSSLFQPIPKQATIKLLKEELADPKVSRSDAKICDPSERRESILRSLFGGYVFDSFGSKLMHRYLNADCRTKYLPGFFDHLLHFHSRALHRSNALIFAVIDEKLIAELGGNIRDRLFAFIKKAYEELSNHCYLVFLIKPFREGCEDGQWRLVSDITLFAEKFREVPLKVGYFSPSKIAMATTSHIATIDSSKARFDFANEGFFFRDCTVLSHLQSGSITTSDVPYDLLLLFEKNDRDESILPCPACRSKNVRGNSYPVLGVKSWECQNALCPSRSAFDRGNRYSLASLIKQKAISSDADRIPESSLRKWKLDVVANVAETDVAEMLLRHFTLHGDKVQFYNTLGFDERLLGRDVTCSQFPVNLDQVGLYDQFQDSSLFSRFVIDRPHTVTSPLVQVPSGLDGVALYHGDSFEVLEQIAASSIGNAITSPPYYNARTYSEWPNIYAYLYDMYNSARAIYRVLRPGGYYLFNIFDYFDNENSVALSAMGKKRMILGAYIINLFRRVGFELKGNTIWYKGEIEGKRNFNQGNRSPYYQLPLNCWEHVLAFRKPGKNMSTMRFPTILATRPVIKMIKGENVLGHSAPFPFAIPDLLTSQMTYDDQILDPFSGSMTTARSARKRGIRSVSIELHREYCELGLKLIRADEEASNYPSLF